MTFFRFIAWSAAPIASGIAAVMALLAACSSDATKPGTAPTGDGGSSGSASSSSGAPAASCAAPGGPAAGSVIDRCNGKFEPVNAASCQATADAGGEDACEYGKTLFGTLQGFDDDCKYQVVVSTTPICSSTTQGAVTFTVSVIDATTHQVVGNLPDGVNIEAYIPTDKNAACDSDATHPSPSTDALKETNPGSGIYKGGIIFDQPGDWTVRFHIHQECKDQVPDSPHGHIAFRLTVP